MRDQDPAPLTVGRSTDTPWWLALAQVVAKSVPHDSSFEPFGHAISHSRQEVIRQSWNGFQVNGNECNWATEHA